MPDFVDRVADELLRAARAPEVAPIPTAAHKWRLRWSEIPRRRRVVALAALVILVAAPALAVTQPWNPKPRQIVIRKGANPRGGVPTGRLSVSTGAPTAQQLALLGILRRPASDRDHSPRVTSALNHLFGGLSGLEIRFVRVLYDEPGQPLVLLIPAKRWSGPPPPPGGSSDSVSNPLCVGVVGPAGAVSGSCEPTEALTGGHLAGSDGPFQYNVIPDGVASAVVHFPDGTRQTLRVRDNFIAFTHKSTTGPTRAPELPSSVEWRDGRGNQVPQTAPGQR